MLRELPLLIGEPANGQVSYAKRTEIANRLHAVGVTGNIMQITNPLPDEHLIRMTVVYGLVTDSAPLLKTMTFPGILGIRELDVLVLEGVVMSQLMSPQLGLVVPQESLVVGLYRAYARMVGQIDAAAIWRGAVSALGGVDIPPNTGYDSTDIKWCVRWALENRQLLAIAAIAKSTQGGWDIDVLSAHPAMEGMAGSSRAERVTAVYNIYAKRFRTSIDASVVRLCVDSLVSLTSANPEALRSLETEVCRSMQGIEYYDSRLDRITELLSQSYRLFEPHVSIVCPHLVTLSKLIPIIPTLQAHSRLGAVVTSAMRYLMPEPN